MPTLSDPAPPSPGANQKTITELRTQTVDLVNDAITASGIPTAWVSSTVSKRPWENDINRTRLASCSTVGAKGSFQITAVVYHQPVGLPHATAEVLSEHWKAQGFTINKVIDSTKGAYVVVEIAAERADGVSYDLFVSTDNISITAYSECSTDPSFEAWIHRDDPPEELPTP